MKTNFDWSVFDADELLLDSPHTRTLLRSARDACASDVRAAARGAFCG
jgi:hypothetical protein